MLAVHSLYLTRYLTQPYTEPYFLRAQPYPEPYFLRAPASGLCGMCMQIVCAPSLAVLSGILQVCARGVCVRSAVIESSTLLLLCSLISFYFASTLLSTLLPPFLYLIPNLIF